MSVTAYASYCGLCLVQGGLVLLPRAVGGSWPARVRARWPVIVVPAAVLVGVTFLPPVASALAGGLSSLALVAVPPLALLGVAWALRWHDRWLLPVVPLLLAFAWTASSSPPPVRVRRSCSSP